jgi:hypothetical protein
MLPCATFGDGSHHFSLPPLLHSHCWIGVWLALLAFLNYNQAAVNMFNN